jgi:hypothetical protein
MARGDGGHAESLAGRDSFINIKVMFSKIFGTECRAERCREKPGFRPRSPTADRRAREDGKTGT